MVKCISINIDDCLIGQTTKYKASVRFLKNIDKILTLIEDNDTILNLHSSWKNRIVDGKIEVIEQNLNKYIDMPIEQRATINNTVVVTNVLNQLLRNKTLHVLSYEKLMTFDKIVFIDNKHPKILKDLRKLTKVETYLIEYSPDSVIKQNTLGMIKMFLGDVENCKQEKEDIDNRKIKLTVLNEDAGYLDKKHKNSIISIIKEIFKPK